MISIGILAIVLMVFCSITLVGIAFAERGPLVEDDQFTPEAPVIPMPLRKRRYAHTPDRILLGIHQREQERAGHWVESPDQGGA
jgi:hypothetical protein